MDVAHIRDVGTKRKDAFWVNFLTHLGGEAVGRLPYERMDTDVLKDTPEVQVFENIVLTLIMIYR
jgi:hypothetical protein